MSGPKLRMVAGPNGSGMSTLLDSLTKRPFNLGYYFNPDAVDAELRKTRALDFGSWGITTDEIDFRSFLDAHALKSFLLSFEWSIRDNVLGMQSELPQGYFVVVLGDFMRRAWLRSRQTFTIETVMSAANKIDLLREALALGYRTYLYYVCTESVLINQDRIANRVREGGHDVPHEKVVQRYERSLALLPDAIRQSSRAYIFDNSTRGSHRLIAEYDSAKLVAVSDSPPAWFMEAALSQPDLSGA